MVRTATFSMLLVLFASSAHAGEYGNYLMHASPSKDMYSYLASDEVAGAFDAGPVMIGNNDSSLVWLRGLGTPPQSPGITVLGNGYEEVFGDSGKKGIYNTALGRQAGDTPRTFSAFMGCEEEMGL